MVKKNAKVEQGEATLKLLVDIARQLFSEAGYAGVSTTAIVEAAGVTRGALYHHFDGKEGLFRAVVEDIQAKIGSQILAAIEGQTDEWKNLVAGCEAFIRASIDPSIRRILLIDAPAVLGRDAWRRIDEEATTTLLSEQLYTLMAQGIIDPQPVEALAHLLAGAMNEAVLWISEADNPETALKQTLATLTRLLNGLRS